MLIPVADRFPPGLICYCTVGITVVIRREPPEERLIFRCCRLRTAL